MQSRGGKKGHVKKTLPLQIQVQPIYRVNFGSTIKLIPVMGKYFSQESYIYDSMEKIIISKRHLDCVRKQRENTRLSSCFSNDFEGKLKRSIELRQEFSDIIPFSPDNKKNCDDFLDALEMENYEFCGRFTIK